MPKQMTIKWLAEPEEHDYPAAEAYLSLLFDRDATQRYVRELRRGPMHEFKAKDVFRASGLVLLPLANSHVKKDEKKIMSGESLSPLLLVRNATNGKVIIADGYHRLCAVYAFDEDAMIPCKIV